MQENLICPVCESQNLKSTVRDLGSWQTLMYCSPYYDEEGNYHHHDYNETRTSYLCSNGHDFVIKSYKRCSCGWVCGTNEVETRS